MAAHSLTALPPPPFSRCWLVLWYGPEVQHGPLQHCCKQENSCRACLSILACCLQCNNFIYCLKYSRVCPNKEDLICKTKVPEILLPAIDKFYISFYYFLFLFKFVTHLNCFFMINITTFTTYGGIWTSSLTLPHVRTPIYHIHANDRLMMDSTWTNQFAPSCDLIGQWYWIFLHCSLEGVW